MPRGTKNRVAQKARPARPAKAKRSKAVKPRNPYPYEIPPIVCPPPEVMKHLHHESVIDILEVEALMRSDTVMAKYRKGKLRHGRLLEGYHIPWDVLKGGHHIYLELAARKARAQAPYYGFEEPYVRLSDAGIEDLQERGAHLRGREAQDLIMEGPDGEEGLEMKFPKIDDLITEIEHDSAQYIYLRIDVGFRPTVILKALEPLLYKRHKEVEGPARVVWENKKRPRYNLGAWLKYFKCYDLKRCGRYSLGDIGRAVYPPGGSEARNLAKNGIAKVREQIKAAELRLHPFHKL